MNIKIVLVFTSILLLLVGCNNEKTAYIDLNSVYSEFAFSQKLEKEREVILNARQSILDSLQLQLNQFSQKFQYKADSNQIKYFNQKREEYYYKEKQFNEDNQLLLAKHNEQITKQLNEYVTDYGKKNGYKYIFGATGNGNMMFADENANISKEVVAYINDKYSGLE